MQCDVGQLMRQVDKKCSRDERKKKKREDEDDGEAEEEEKKSAQALC